MKVCLKCVLTQGTLLAIVILDIAIWRTSLVWGLALIMMPVLPIAYRVMQTLRLYIKWVLERADEKQRTSRYSSRVRTSTEVVPRTNQDPQTLVSILSKLFTVTDGTSVTVIDVQEIQKFVSELDLGNGDYSQICQELVAGLKAEKRLKFLKTSDFWEITKAVINSGMNHNTFLLGVRDLLSIPDIDDNLIIYSLKSPGDLSHVINDLGGSRIPTGDDQTLDEILAQVCDTASDFVEHKILDAEQTSGIDRDGMVTEGRMVG